MNYNDEDKEDKKYKGKYKKQQGPPVPPPQQEAQPIEVIRKKIKKKKKVKFTEVPLEEKPKKKTKRSEYAKMKASELRKFLTGKKNALLSKAGFPEGKIPRNKESMVNLCMKLKRKRW